jgi:predicted nuclease with TOPRIM domain
MGRKNPIVARIEERLKAIDEEKSELAVRLKYLDDEAMSLEGLLSEQPPKKPRARTKATDAKPSLAREETGGE